MVHRCLAPSHLPLGHSDRARQCHALPRPSCAVVSRGSPFLRSPRPRGRVVSTVFPFSFHPKSALGAKGFTPSPSAGRLRTNHQDMSAILCINLCLTGDFVTQSASSHFPPCVRARPERGWRCVFLLPLFFVAAPRHSFVIQLIYTVGRLRTKDQDISLCAVDVLSSWNRRVFFRRYARRALRATLSCVFSPFSFLWEETKGRLLPSRASLMPSGMDTASMCVMRRDASRLAADRSERGFREAVKLWTQLSDEGCPESMCELASCHGQGEGGCVQNWGRAVELFRAAAIKGYRLAQYNLGCRYVQGEVPGETGTERFAIAVFWWEFRVLYSYQSFYFQTLCSFVGAFYRTFYWMC